MTREELLREIQVVSFVMDDLRLYLDTHKHDGEAQQAFIDRMRRRDALMHDYAYAYGPLTTDIMYAGDPWPWADDPWPWEGED